MNSPVIDSEFIRLIQRLYKKKPPTPCMFVGENGSRCKNRAILSHSLQRSVTLKHIAESGHVYMIGIKPLDFKKRGDIGEIKIGLSKASVFPGFCKKHDQDLFKEAEISKVEPNERLSLLLGYRVVCMELHKKIDIEGIFSDHELRKRATNAGTLHEIEAFLEGTSMARVDLKRTKEKYESALHGNGLDGFRASIFELSKPLPFCFAAPFAPEFDFAGNPLLPHPEEDWESVAAFAGRIGDRDVFLVSGFDHNENHDISGFIRGLSKIDHSIVGDIALQIALEYAENSYYRISWFDGLDLGVKFQMISQFASGVPGNLDGRKKSITNCPKIINIEAKESAILIEF